ncbi:putative Late nodulin [Medicago truncatula]|uniref:Nodule Cysteine-Rich (NCR) secreted peptide n=1 Tax=Medicago truncatula TaxID=3880 RepID=A0A072V7Y8_MEDTR|nr:Nodule Cysteine-Rich (NCR) secreted peptide [Medicago truncatula]RHN73839.1 putative Late nodulin [Medicago truncatula]
MNIIFKCVYHMIVILLLLLVATEAGTGNIRQSCEFDVDCENKYCPPSHDGKCVWEEEGEEGEEEYCGCIPR